VTAFDRPADFTAIDDATAQASGGWEIPGVPRPFQTNPTRLLLPSDHRMLSLWLWTRTGGFGGARLLPDRGGIQDQAAVMLDAIRIMDDQYARLHPTKKEDER